MLRYDQARVGMSLRSASTWCDPDFAALAAAFGLPATHG